MDRGSGKKLKRRGGWRRFAYGLALELGYASVDRMLAEMTWAELMEWRAFFSLRAKEAEKPAAKPRPGNGKGDLGRITGALMGYQNRRKTHGQTQR